MPKSKKKGEGKAALRIVLIVSAVLLLAAAFRIYEDVFAANLRLEKDETAYLYIYSNKGFYESLETNNQYKLFKNAKAFARLAALSGWEGSIRPGRYKITAGMGNFALLRLLRSGKQEPLDIRFNYAERKQDLAAYWAQKLEADSNELLALLNNPVLMDSLELDTAAAIALFIPNTYNFYWNTSAMQLVERMHEEYTLFWDSARVQKATQLGLSKKEVVILASIVQKETHRKDEMPVVAGVYYNRLQRGMLFQADPTVIYAMNDKSIRRVQGAMLKVESPYNTYKYKGLPPGPICVPSVQAVDAVLNMQRHAYIYFCAKEDFSGYHNFAASFAQHQVNARKYQRMLNQRGIR